MIIGGFDWSCLADDSDIPCQWWYENLTKPHHDDGSLTRSFGWLQCQFCSGNKKLSSTYECMDILSVVGAWPLLVIIRMVLYRARNGQESCIPAQGLLRGTSLLQMIQPNSGSLLDPRGSNEVRPPHMVAAQPMRPPFGSSPQWWHAAGWGVLIILAWDGMGQYHPYMDPMGQYLGPGMAIILESKIGYMNIPLGKDCSVHFWDVQEGVGGSSAALTPDRVRIVGCSGGGRVLIHFQISLLRRGNVSSAYVRNIRMHQCNTSYSAQYLEHGGHISCHHSCCWTTLALQSRTPFTICPPTIAGQYWYGPPKIDQNCGMFCIVPGFSPHKMLMDKLLHQLYTSWSHPSKVFCHSNRGGILSINCTVDLQYDYESLSDPERDIIKPWVENEAYWCYPGTNTTSKYVWSLW